MTRGPDDEAPEIFLAPLFRGGRFNKHVLLVDVLPELQRFEKMIRELAKQIYNAQNVRQHAPAGFDKWFRLGIVDIGTGRSAQPKMVRVSSEDAPEFDEDNDPFVIARDRIELTLTRVAAGDPVPADLPDKVKTALRLVGSNLEDDEEFEYRRDVDVEGPLVNAEVRLRLAPPPAMEQDAEGVRAPVVDRFDLTGMVIASSIDPARIEIRVKERVKYTAPVEVGVALKVMHSCGGRAVRMRGTGEVDEAGRVQRIQTVDDLTPLVNLETGAPTPIAAKIEELRRLQDGWYDGESTALDRRGLDLVEGVLEQLVSQRGLPIPHLGPTPDGEVHAEWRIDALDLSATFDLLRGLVYVHALNHATDRSVDSELPYTGEGDFDRVSMLVIEMIVEGHETDA